ncbi:hypothetical protein [Parasitella parasitica]|uniref:Muskelin N-terminal domain-containing protein n=1 Tax=Parasitella parasitica TaxID=35722 RepID=A0A0B7NF36_9FUNG|nr:hypothetical protein [Parasitella parasitica]
MDKISSSGSNSSDRSSGSNESNESLLMDKELLVSQPLEDYHPLSCIPLNSSSQNSKKDSIQNRLSNIFYTKSSKVAETASMNVTALTKQHMTRAAHLSGNGGTVASLMAKTKQVQLSYVIHDYSSHSGTYHPQNIMVNKPTQQASRWSSGLHDHEQYITIKLDKPAVARTITFGKFHKGHVCNLKEFKVYGGMDPKEEMIEILHHGLKNDTEPETFVLKNQHGNMIFPVRYLKIVPLSAFGANFNYSIWYVGVRGTNQENIIQRVCAEYENFKETETTRLCLKYFRQKNMMDVFHILRNRTGVELEHPLISDLHRCLVVDANFTAAEQVLHTVYQRNMYKPYSDSVKYTPIWKQIQASNEDGEAPCARGGHQMCIDVQDRMIYILGGWDGKQDLSDFWCYNILENRWSLLSIDTRIQGGPSPRSCHKICFDPASRSIFVLGRYVESPPSAGQTLDSDFYRYYIESNQWLKINESTSKAGGPELIYDHQMCIDPEVDSTPSISGRATGSLNDDAKLCAAIDSIGLKQNSSLLKSRVGHSMLFDQRNKSLYVFAGQRGKDYLSDLYRYQVNKDIVTEIAQDYSKDAGPDASFTQRATIDEDLQELYVLSGYMRNSGGDIVRNTLWVYSIEKNEWQKVFQNENRDSECWTRISKFEPGPRFAHQMVYDPVSKKQYIFGGNPGDNLDTTKRLDDFWELVLSKPDPSSILQKSFYMIRMQKLKELCSKVCDKQRHHSDEDNDDTMIALDYLRNHVEPVVNHENESESNEFHQICANLCLLQTLNDDNEQNDGRDLFVYDIIKSEDTLYMERTKLFEKLLAYIPQDMKEPSGKLTNAVKMKPWGPKAHMLIMATAAFLPYTVSAALAFLVAGQIKPKPHSLAERALVPHYLLACGVKLF